MLVFAFIHGVRTSVVWRALVTSDDARPCPMENRPLATAVSSSSTCNPVAVGLGGEGGIGDLGLCRLGAGGVGGRCGERSCIRECAGAAN